MAEAAFNTDIQKRREFFRSTINLRAEANPVSESSAQPASAVSELPQRLSGYSDELTARRELSAEQFNTSEETQKGDGEPNASADVVDRLNAAMRLAKTLRTARIVSIASIWGIIVYIALLNYQFLFGNILQGTIFPSAPLSMKEVLLLLVIDGLLFSITLMNVTLMMVLSNPCAMASSGNSVVTTVLSPILKQLCPNVITP